MIVCLCHRISDRDIAREAKAGCATFEALMERTRVATACGACLDHAREAFDGQAPGECAHCPGAARCGATTVTLAA
jgi:bacterioferritin-associated ferredoxin